MVLLVARPPCSGGVAGIFDVCCGFAADDDDDASTIPGASSNATMTSSLVGGSDVIACKRRCRSSSLDCLSLIVDSLVTPVVAESSSALRSTFNVHTTTTPTIM